MNRFETSADHSQQDIVQFLPVTAWHSYRSLKSTQREQCFELFSTMLIVETLF